MAAGTGRLGRTDLRVAKKAHRLFRRGKWWGGDGKRVSARDPGFTGLGERGHIHCGRGLAGRDRTCRLSRPRPRKSDSRRVPPLAKATHRDGQEGGAVERGRRTGSGPPWAYLPSAQRPFHVENQRRDHLGRPARHPAPAPLGNGPMRLRQPLPLSALTFPSKRP